MDAQSKAKHPLMGGAAMGLIMSAGLNRSLKQARIDPDRIGSCSLETSGVFLTFFECHSESAGEFLTRAGVDQASLASALRQERPPEPPPDPRRLPENPTDEQRENFEFFQKMDAERQAKGEAAPFSGPVKLAQRRAKDEARMLGTRVGLGTLIAVLIETEGHARDAVLDHADPLRLPDALQWLRAQPDPPEKATLKSPEEVRSDFVRIQEAAWAGTRDKREANLTEEARQRREAHYEKDPAFYESPLDLAAELAKEPPNPAHSYAWRTGICRRAARNEARIRRAPEATLDHLLVALLGDGTDTARFLDARGIDRAGWSRRLDAELPRFADATRWPLPDRALGMGGPESRTIRLIKPLPEGVSFGDLPGEEVREYVRAGEDPTKIFTDLAFATRFPTEPHTIGYRLFEESALDVDDLKTERTAREKNDPEWWRRPFDLVEKLREGMATNPLPDFVRHHAYREAARYEARLRGAPIVEIDDLLVALIVPGTDVWSLLVDRGFDPNRIKLDLDAQRPRFDKGPVFPHEEDINMRLLILSKVGFSDLLFLRPDPLVRPDPLGGAVPSPGLLLLWEQGLTLEIVDDRLTELGVVPI